MVLGMLHNASLKHKINIVCILCVHKYLLHESSVTMTGYFKSRLMNFHEPQAE